MSKKIKKKRSRCGTSCCSLPDDGFTAPKPPPGKALYEITFPLGMTRQSIIKKLRGADEELFVVDGSGIGGMTVMANTGLIEAVPNPGFQIEQID